VLPFHKISKKFSEFFHLDSVNSTAVRASWEEPTITNGIITQYRLLVDQVVRFEGLEMTAVIGSLMPYQ